MCQMIPKPLATGAPPQTPLESLQRSSRPLNHGGLRASGARVFGARLSSGKVHPKYCKNRLLDHFHLSHQKFGINCRVISRPLQLFLLLEEVSNIIFSCVRTLTVGHLVASCHLNISCFLIQHRLLPSHHLEICRPANAFHLSAYD